MDQRRTHLKITVIGANGFIGIHLVNKLIEQNLKLMPLYIMRYLTVSKIKNPRLKSSKAIC